MLRGDKIGNFESCFHLSVGQDDHAVILQRCGCDLPPAQNCNLAFQLCLNGLCKILIPRYKHGRGIRVMLCLRQHISCQNFRIVLSVCYDQHLAGACHRIGRNNTMHLLLGFSHISISGSYNFIYLRDALRAEGQSSDCLCPAHLINLINSSYRCRSQDRRVHFSASIRRSDHYDFITSGNSRRDQIHQHGGWVCCRSVWHIHAHLLDRAKNLTENNTVLSRDKDVSSPLFLMINTNILGSFPQHSQESRIHSGKPLFILFAGNGKI